MPRGQAGFHLLLRDRLAKRVHVACLRRAAAADHLRREVTERPGGARARKPVRAAYCRVFGHVEVAEARPAGRIDQHVVGFHVRVHDAVGVHVRDGLTPVEVPRAA